MSRRAQLIAAGAILLVGVLVLAWVLLGTKGSVRDDISSRYRRVQVADAAYEGARVYESPREPSRVVQEITDRWKPAERYTDAAGYFLRYRSDMVVVTPGPEGGSRIYVDEERRGYARWYPYIGGTWGTYSGPAETRRGGGPGGGGK